MAPAWVAVSPNTSAAAASARGSSTVGLFIAVLLALASSDIHCSVSCTVSVRDAVEQRVHKITVCRPIVSCHLDVH